MVTQSLPVRTLLKPLLFILFCLSASPLFAQTVTYTYDALGRVTFVQDSTNGNRDYDYDAAGNRLLVSTGTANDPAAEPQPPGLLPAPTGLQCYENWGPGAWKAAWTAVPGADHYILRTTNLESTIYGTSNTSPIQQSSKPCMWVKACDASNNCGAQANF